MTEFISVTERNFISNFLVTDPLSYDRITDELTIGNWSAKPLKCCGYKLR